MAEASGFAEVLRKLAKGRALIFVLGLGFTFFCLALYIYPPIFLTYVDYKFYDILHRDLAKGETTGIPVIVDIDEKSLSEVGQWPWPRHQVAILAARILEGGALAVGFDVMFAEPDRTSPVNLIDDYRKLGLEQVRIVGLPGRLLDNDQLLADVISGGPVVLGYHFGFAEDRKGKGRDCLLHSMNIAELKTADAGEVSSYLLRSPSATCNVAALAQAARGVGFFNTMPDPDGIIRRSPLLIEYSGKVYPSLAVATLGMALDLDQAVVRATSGGIESLRLGDFTIPLDAQGRFLIKFRGPGHTFRYYSAADVLAGRLPAEALKDKLVFVGTSAAGLMDLRATPLDTVYPGVEAHATIVDNILKGDYIARPDWAPGLEFVLIILAGALATLFLAYSRATWALIPTVLGSAGIWEGAHQLMVSQQIFVSPLMPLIALVGNYGLLTAWKFWREEKEKAFFRSAFSRYLSKAVVDQIVAHPDKLSLRGEERETTIFFSDIRSFTSISEKLSPSQVTELLHAYFTPMTRIVTAHSGTLDKFIGDAIMAFWNAPVDTRDHQAQGVAACLEMVETLKRLNVEFLERFGLELAIGMGLHCGTVRVGNMGSEDLFDYTIIGDSVNLASRLEGLTKFYGVSLVVSQTIRDACADRYVFQALDSVRVKGKAEPIAIYTAYPPEQAEALREELALHDGAMRLYKAGDFPGAEAAFADLAGRWPERKLYRLYAERCGELRREAPVGPWDGVYTHESK